MAIQLEKLKNKSGNIEQIIGVRTEAQIVKNRMGPPFKKANFDIYFDSGIDDVNSWLTLLKDYEVIKQSGSWYMMVGPDGDELKFQAKDWRNMINVDDDLREYCYNKICEVVIMKYRAEDINPDEILTDDELPND
jgi:recombination protein RecA